MRTFAITFDAGPSADYAACARVDGEIDIEVKLAASDKAEEASEVELTVPGADRSSVVDGLARGETRQETFKLSPRFQGCRRGSPCREEVTITFEHRMGESIEAWLTGKAFFYVHGQDGDAVAVTVEETK